MIQYGHRLGLAANKIEQLLLNPGYLALFVSNNITGRYLRPRCSATSLSGPSR